MHERSGFSQQSADLVAGLDAEEADATVKIVLFCLFSNCVKRTKSRPDKYKSGSWQL